MSDVAVADLPLVAAVLWLALSAGFWLWTLVDCVAHEPREDGSRALWLTILLSTSLIGACLYCFLRRPERLAEQGR